MQGVYICPTKRRKTMKAHIKIVLDTRREKVGNVYPVKLRVTYQRKQKYYPTNIDLSVDDFDRVFGDKPRGEHKANRELLETMRSKIVTATDNLPVFTFDLLEAALKSPKKQGLNKSLNLRAAFMMKAELMKSEERYKAAESYVSAMRSILQDRTDLTFNDVTTDFLKQFEKRFTSEGKSKATVGLYLRNLRSLFNDAIADGVVSADAYPFRKGRNGYQIPSIRNEPHPLTQAEISMLYKYEPANDSERRARDFWMFSYLLNGANLKDVFSLRWGNIDTASRRIKFFRSKTEKSARQQTAVIVALTNEMQSIIERWGTKQQDKQSYVFQVFEEGMTGKKKHLQNEYGRRKIRLTLKAIAATIGLKREKIHNYDARDTFAQAQRIAGETGDIIGEALGHEIRTTTGTYMARNQDAVIRRLAENALRYMKGEAIEK